jgi:hypothetical protein
MVVLAVLVVAAERQIILQQVEQVALETRQR